MTEYLNYWLKLIKDTPNDMKLGKKVREIVNNKKTENMKMISLYDYLGHAAGSDLGKQVAIAASKAGIKSEIREVSHVGYKGPIMLYPRQFLDNFFGGGLSESTSGKQLLKG